MAVDILVSMDAASGNTVYGTNGLSGTVVGGASQTAGKVGLAMSMGTNQYIDFGSHPMDCLGNFAYCDDALTVGMWAKLMAPIGASTWISIFTNNGGGMTYFATRQGSSTIKIQVYCVTNGNGKMYTTTVSVSDSSAWHHHAVSCSKQNTHRLYFNGTEHIPQGESISSYGGIGPSGSVWLGKINVNDRPFACDELSFWFKELDAASAKAYFEQYRP